MKKGIILGLGTYLIWGFLPIYLKLLSTVAPLQILMHRVVWALLFLTVILFTRRQWAEFRRSIASWRILVIYSLAAVLLAVNWLTYIWGVNSGQIIETSLGYFINPLVSVLLGVVILRERLRPMQWLPVSMAAIGVAYLAFSYGRLPWIALVLAFTFGLYGLLKKLSPLGSLYGLTIETSILFLPALGYLIYAASNGSGAFGQSGIKLDILMVFLGVVTAVPLLMFGAAARLVPLSMIGLMQYLAPTCQFLIGVLVYNEPFSSSRMLGFAIIWLALLIYLAEGMAQQRKQASISNQLVVTEVPNPTTQ